MAHHEANSVPKGMKKRAEDHITHEDPVPQTTDLLVQGYLLHCRCEGKSPSTITTYEEHLRRFVWYCERQHFPSDPRKLTSHHIGSFIWYVGSESNRWGTNSTTSRKPAGRATVNHYYRVLHAFFGWLAKQGFIAENPVSRIGTPKTDRRVVEALNPGEVEKLLRACAGRSVLEVRNRAIISILLDTGLRVSELASLKINDIDTKTGVILVRHGKGGKQRIVRTGSKALRAAWRYIAAHRRGDGDALFLTRSGEPLDAEGMKLMIRRLTKRAGFRVSGHKLRHTFSISYLRNGGDVFTLQYLLGHSTLHMTQRYLQSLSSEDAIKAHRRFSPLDNM